MSKYHIDQNKFIHIIFAQSVKDQKQFNKEIALNEDCIVALINAEYLISLQACLIAVYKMLKLKEYKSSHEFQKDLHYLLIPEDTHNDNRFTVNNIWNSRFVAIFLTDVNEKQLSCFEQDELTNLYQYCNIPEIIKYYKISDEELKVEKDLRGAIFNQIVLKKLK